MGVGIRKWKVVEVSHIRFQLNVNGFMTREVHDGLR
jgi:hypothetical protein